MRTTIRTSFALAVIAAALGSTAYADVITQFTGGPAGASTLFIGQQVNTSSGGPWNNLTFNWFSDTSGGTTPSATGDIFLLSSAYTGTPSALSSATPGFIAESVGVVSNVFVFDPLVTLQPNTTYFLYADATNLVSGSNTGSLYDGGAFLAPGASSSYAAFSGADANFQLSGTAVPEPATVSLLGLGMIAALAVQIRRRAKQNA